MRALAGRASDAELISVEAWRASSPENARRFRELERMLAGIEEWYRATPLRSPPSVETLIRRAELRRAPDGDVR